MKLYVTIKQVVNDKSVMRQFSNCDLITNKLSFWNKYQIIHSLFLQMSSASNVLKRVFFFSCEYQKWTNQVVPCHSLHILQVLFFPSIALTVCWKHLAGDPKTTSKRMLWSRNVLKMTSDYRKWTIVRFGDKKTNWETNYLLSSFGILVTRTSIPRITQF